MAPFALQSERRSAQLLGRLVSLTGGSSSHLPPRVRQVEATVSSGTPFLFPSAPAPISFVPQTNGSAVSTPDTVPMQLPSVNVGLAGVCAFAGAGLLLIVGWQVHKYRRRKQDPHLCGKVCGDIRSNYCDGKASGPQALGVPPSLPTSPSVMWKPSIGATSTHQGSHEYLSQELPKPKPAATKVAVLAGGWFKENVTFSNNTVSHPKLAPMQRLAPSVPTSVTNTLTSNFNTPKLVTVVQTFPVNLHDELEVRVGEVLRLIQEFKDGWALCQRVGQANAEKGAVPFCCLAERSAIAPHTAITGATRALSTARSIAAPSLLESHTSRLTSKMGKNSASPPIKRSSSFAIGLDVKLHQEKGSRTARD